MTQPVFLLGFQRSGTNMTVWTLDKSPSLTLYNENEPQAFEDYKLLPLERIKKLVGDTTTPVALLKPISDSYRLEEFTKEYEELKVIYIFRYYLDVISSYKREFNQDGYNILKNRFKNKSFANFEWFDGDKFVNFHSVIEKYEHGSYNDLIALTWIEQACLLIDNQSLVNSRVLVVNYDEVCMNPEGEFTRMFEFCNLSFDSNYTKDIRVARSQPIYCDLDPIVALNAELMYLKLCYIRDNADKGKQVVFKNLIDATPFMLSNAASIARKNSYFAAKANDENVMESTVTIPKFDLDKLHKQLKDTEAVAERRYQHLEELRAALHEKNAMA